MLGRRRGKGCTNLAVQFTTHPDATGLIPEASHLAGHSTKAGTCAYDNGVIILKFIDCCNFGFLVDFKVSRLRHFQWGSFGNALYGHIGTAVSCTFCDCFGHCFKVAIAGIIENKNFSHGRFPFGK